MTFSTIRWCACVLAVGFVSGCGSDDEMGSMMEASIEDDAASECPADTPEFLTGGGGLTQMDRESTVKVRIDSATSQPPSKDYNTWEIAITDPADAPLPNAVVTWACAWMPTHGHGTNPKMVEKLPDGRVALRRMNLSMNGGWNVRLWIDPTGAGTIFAAGREMLNSAACTPPSGSAGANIEFKICVPRDRGAN